jgi:arginyl-tRNA synthetase
MNLITNLKQTTANCIEQLYDVKILPEQVLVNATKPEFEGDYTIVLFAFVKQLGKSPEVLGNELGAAMLNAMPGVLTQFNIVKGFLNFSISNQFWFDSIKHADDTNLLPTNNNPKKIMVEYSSPNTNKPLHLGHLRNNFLGWSIAEILKLQGNYVVKTCIVNDRGIHICKSMIAWQLFANGATPADTNQKGDQKTRLLISI